MNEAGTKWFDDLKSHVSECRRHRSFACRDSLSLVEEMQCRIIGGSLIGWLNTYGPRLLQERSVLAAHQGWEKEPFVIFTSEEAGLIAANEILAGSISTMAFMYADEFSSWATSHPDIDFRWHVHTWSFFAALDAVTLQRAARYPLLEGENYWLHREGTVCGPLFGRGGDHLWKWNGEVPMLLEECFNQWSS